MMNDLHNNAQSKRIIAPIAIGANATKTGVIIDTQGFGGVEIIASYGAVTTTGTIVDLVVLEGDTTGAMTSVADADLLGTELLASLPVQATARTSEVGKNVSKRVGYRGGSRYIQVNSISTGTTSVGCISVDAVMHSPNIAPVDNP